MSVIHKARGQSSSIRLGHVDIFFMKLPFQIEMAIAYISTLTDFPKFNGRTGVGDIPYGVVDGMADVTR